MKQEWFCEMCCVGGSCTIPKEAGVYDAINRVSAAHMKKSVICGNLNNLKRVRVRAPGCSGKEWKKVRDDARAQRLNKTPSEV